MAKQTKKIRVRWENFYMNLKFYLEKKRRIVLLILLFFALALIWGYGKLLELEYVKQHFSLLYITLEENDLRSFLNAVWQVQTSVSILTITFITLIMGRLHTQVHGFKLNEIMVLNKKKLNYWEKVWLNIGTVGLNFFYVSMADTSSVTLVFLISLFLTVSLLMESLHILRTPEDFEQRVADYINLELENAINTEKASFKKVDNDTEKSNDINVDASISKEDENDSAALFLLPFEKVKSWKY